MGPLLPRLMSSPPASASLAPLWTLYFDRISPGSSQWPPVSGQLSIAREQQCPCGFLPPTFSAAPRRLRQIWTSSQISPLREPSSYPSGGGCSRRPPDPALAPHQPGYHPSPHPCRNRSDPFAPQDSPWPEPSPLAPCCFNHSEIFSLTALSRGTRPPPAPHLLQAGFSSVPFSQPHSASRYLPSPLLTSRSSPSPPLHRQTRGLPRCFCTAVPRSQDQGLPSCCWGDATQSTKSTEIAMTGIESHVDRRHS